MKAVINFICIILALFSTVALAVIRVGVTPNPSCEILVTSQEHAKILLEIEELHIKILDLKAAGVWELHKNSQALAMSFYRTTENATAHAISATAQADTKEWVSKRLLLLAGSYFGSGRPSDKEEPLFRTYRALLAYRMSSRPEARIIPWTFYLWGPEGNLSNDLWYEWERERLALLGLKWALGNNEDPERIENVIAVIAKNRGPDRAKLLLWEALISVPPELRLRLFGSLGWAYAFERNPNNSFRNLIGQYLPKAGVQQVVQEVIKNFVALDMGSFFVDVTPKSPDEFQIYAVWVTDLIKAFENEYIISRHEAMAVQKKLKFGIKKGFIQDPDGKMMAQLNQY